MVRTDLIAKAKSGDERAFEELVAPHRRELHVHCYRILGSAEDAEDVLQEALLSAWQGLSGFEERASLRTWLYRIATNRCLNALRSAERRPQMDGPLFELPVPEPTRHGEVFWLEPYPDALFDEIADDAPSPEARYDAAPGDLARVHHHAPAPPTPPARSSDPSRCPRLSWPTGCRDARYERRVGREPRPSRSPVTSRRAPCAGRTPTTRT